MAENLNAEDTVRENDGYSGEYPADGASAAGRKIENSADKKISFYRLMSSADAFFSRKSYEEAYVGYGAALDADKSCLKAYFRRELSSRYLMMESSSVYLKCESFFAELKDIKERLIEENDEKLSFTVCRDILDFIAFLADYGRKYASIHKNEKTAASYISDTLLLFEYTAEVVKHLSEMTNPKNERERAFLLSDGCALGMKLRGMLLSGAEYVETAEKMNDLSGEPTAKNVSRIKRLRLSQDDELQVETLTGNMRKAKSDLMESVSPGLYAELKEAGEKSEKAVKSADEDDSRKRLEYETWRQRNEKEYVAADKRILIFGIAGKAALVMAGIMVIMFIVELLANNSVIGQLLIVAAVFVAADVALGFLRKSAVKKKSFYSKVIESDSANMRTAGKDFKG